MDCLNLENHKTKIRTNIMDVLNLLQFMKVVKQQPQLLLKVLTLSAIRGAKKRAH